MAESIDKKLAAALLQARGKRVHFALVLKGGSDGVLLVSPKKIPPAEIAAAKKECGGTALVAGTCLGEKGVLVFETTKVPQPNWAKVVKKLAKERGGATINPEFRLVQQEAAGADEAPDEAAAPAAAVPPAGPADDLAAQWQKRHAEVEPRYLERLRARPDDAGQLRAVMGYATGQAEAGQYGKALAALKKMEPFLTAAPAAAPPGADKAAAPPAARTPAGPADDLAAQWQKRHAEVEPRYLEQLRARPDVAGQLRAVMGYATGQAEAGQYGKALTGLKQMEPFLAAAPAAAPASAPGGADAALETWQRARGTAVDQLRALAAAIAQSGDPETRRAIILLQAIIKNLTTRPASRQSAAELERYLLTDDIIAEAEEPNPFGLAVKLRAPLLAAVGPLKVLLPA